jgi:Tol biopolymer transport system component
MYIPFDRVQDIAFSHDGGRVAYTAVRNRKWFAAVADRKPSGDFEAGWTPVFPEGTVQVAPAEGRPDREYVILVNETRSNEYDAVEPIVFSPDGKRIAFAAKRDDHWLIVVDGMESSRKFELVWEPVFSPDSTRIAYAVKLLRKSFVAVQSATQSEWQDKIAVKMGAPFDSVTGPVFSPDGRNVAYGAFANGRWLVVAGLHRSEEYDAVWSPVFDATGSKVAFGAKKGKNVWWKVMKLHR